MLDEFCLPKHWNDAWSYERKEDILSRAAMKPSWCYTHNCFCPPRFAQVEGPSGTPCPDYSSSGLLAGTAGTTVKVPLAWCRKATVFRTPLFSHENVNGFPDTIIARNTPKHDMVRIPDVSPSHAGFDFIDRPRVFDLGWCPECVNLTAEPMDCYGYIAERMQSHAPIGIRDTLMSTYGDVWKEEMAICRTRGLSWRPGHDSSYILNRSEKERLQWYDVLYWRKSGGKIPCMDPDMVYGLGDDPWGRISWAFCGRLPTFRRNTCRLWSPWAKRFITLTERYSQMGFPCDDKLAQAAGANKVFPIPDQPHTAQTMLGNSMHVANATMVLATHLSCFELLQS